MGSGDVDWQRLAMRGQAQDERRGLLDQLLTRDDPRVDTLCTTFVSAALHTVELEAAFSEAAVAAAGHLGMVSLTVGSPSRSGGRTRWTACGVALVWLPRQR
jgi:hypothetical protein